MKTRLAMLVVLGAAAAVPAAVFAEDVVSSETIARATHQYRMSHDRATRDYYATRSYEGAGPEPIPMRGNRENERFLNQEAKTPDGGAGAEH